MVEYFYTLDMGKTYGPKLQRLAVEAGYDDVEAFAAMIVADAIDAIEACAMEMASSEDDGPENGRAKGSDGRRMLDDGIPF
ncbi:hypothetical protein ACFQXB_01560 [Plastorhodobacter daqingensis]|uniref:Uncharacterized protein n=1 Tax=Plastorhodobacter daqingensis TaxID=1387281 RepID=A0ABW2UHE0_9RHOB